jgi:hypothetical protein
LAHDVQKKTSGFLREIRLPRLSVTKLKLRIDQLEREIVDLAGQNRILGSRNWELRASSIHMGEECARFQLEMAKAVALIDALDRAPTAPPPRMNGAQRRQLESLRLMSILTIDAKGGDAT